MNGTSADDLQKAALEIRPNRTSPRKVERTRWGLLNDSSWAHQQGETSKCHYACTSDSVHPARTQFHPRLNHSEENLDHQLTRSEEMSNLDSNLNAIDTGGPFGEIGCLETPSMGDFTLFTSNTSDFSTYSPSTLQIQGFSASLLTSHLCGSDAHWQSEDYRGDDSTPRYYSGNPHYPVDSPISRQDTSYLAVGSSPQVFAEMPMTGQWPSNYDDYSIGLHSDSLFCPY
ncbi:hypothetical protein N7539_008584 [Penicillium diatomitis]|uniref:Uncharacterized protein n=1 Tax=Penicillium diatomitis TaxID=2819901 RepID=A0A9X0BLK7_9EURO|nr:uncharacterized protein N7539_008804 [Penicillium diatomitis]XP_056786561.1 uncharacterized protein N7539_008584 [Penicillium diatomitis]KAJ5471861.1 hypothetical protein N7539_008804 [Penicillium diatomitis]KAJ5472015.1 hypothetical protein N7539_008584 [Penicillium diatomitis]